MTQPGDESAASRARGAARRAEPSNCVIHLCMPERADHCPFLNRADSRCAEHFTIDGLHHAFEHCFDRYKQCRTYVELLVERRVKRGSDLAAAGRETDGNGRHVIEVSVAAAAGVVAAGVVPVVSRV
jgi:hypothetical protein